MFENFTDTSRKTVALANQETHRLRGDIIGDVELLLGIVIEGRGTGAITLRGLGVDMGMLRRELERQPRHIGDESAPPKLPQTQEFKLAIEAAIATARELGHARVGTHHMLLGMLRYPQFASAQTLASHGIAFEQVLQSASER